MDRKRIETALGTLVVLAGLSFIAAAYNTADLQRTRGYTIEARFFKVGGLQEGNEVRIGGIKVGTVSNLVLDPQTYDAVAEITLHPKLKIPVDSVAAIGTDGLLGGQYLILEPGTETELLKAGDVMERTKDASSLEDIIGDIIF